MFALTFVMMFASVAGGILVVSDVKLNDAQTGARQSAQVLQGVTALSEQAPYANTFCVLDGVESFSCFENYYRGLVAGSGVKTAFDDLKARYEANPFLKSQCHQLTHVIGRSAVDLYPTLPAMFSNGDSFCWSGYYHGVMETIAGNAGAGALPSMLDKMCDGIPGKENYSFEYYNCVHGLGHGIMAVKDGELFESLLLCDTLAGGWEKLSCAGGVFMENIMDETRTGTSKYLKDGDLLYPCDAVADYYKTPCFLMQTSHMLHATGYDWKRVFATCAVAEPAYRPACYQSIGRDASGSTVSDAEKIIKICAIGINKAQKEGCVAGAAKDIVSYYNTDVQAKKFCDLLDKSLAPLCISTVSAYYKTPKE